MRVLGYSLRETGKSIARNPFLSIATVFTSGVAMFVLALFLLGAINLANLAEFVERQVQVSIYLEPDVTEGDRLALKGRVEKLDGVDEVVYVSREEALERLRVQYGENAALLDGIDEFNPLRDALEVSVTEAAVTDLVAEVAHEHPAVQDVSYGRELVAQLISMTRAVRLGLLALAGLLAVATLFLVQNSIRLSVFARRDEIVIMRLVGATAGVVRWPFVLEGMTLTGVGAICAISLAAAGYSWTWQYADTNLAFLPVVPTAQAMRWIGPYLLGAGGLIGALGALFALRRWMRAPS